MTLKNFAMKAGLAGAMLLAGTAASFAASAYATNNVNVRSGPGTQYSVVDQLYDGEDVDVLSCRGDWCKIEHSGPDGWVSAAYLGRDRNVVVDDGPDFFINGGPRFVPGPFYRPGPFARYPYASFCVGGSNARFCVRG